jgi:hypothetical protein
MSKVVIVNYTIQEAFKIPASIDLEDKSVVKFWGVKWNKLCIYFVDGTEKEIESEGWIDEFDYKRPTGEPEIDYANNYGLEEEEEAPPPQNTKPKIPLIIESDTEDDDESFDDDHFKCDRCKVIKDCEEYISIDNDPSGNTICEQCLKAYIKERGLEDSDSEDEDSDDEDSDDEDVLCCERCGYEDYKNEEGEWTEVLTHTESDRVFCKKCMPK